MSCSGKECRYVEQKVSNMRDYETWTIHWFTRKITVTKGVSGPGKDALKAHVKSLNGGKWEKPCGEGCKCVGKWQKPTKTKITLRVGDKVFGAIAMCSADLEQREFVGKCSGE